MATFLACLLLGIGYNAYVVSGYASKDRCLCDQSIKPCPYLPPPAEPPPPPPPPVVSKYRPTSPPDFNSKFYQKLEELEQRRIQEEFDRQEENRLRMIAEREKPRNDPLFGQRLHAWIMLLPGSLGPRGQEVTEVLFIEPTTAEWCSPSKSETANWYLGIESIWNNRNYWVNMQNCSEACTKLEWDLENTRNWEHLLAGEPANLRNVEDDEDPEINIRRELHLAMPPPYINRIQISNRDYEERYPNGSKTMYYKKSKVELFAPFLHTSGLIESVTTYEDYEYNKPIYVYEKYQERGDKLVRSEKDLCKEIVTDYYAQGRVDACKAHQYFIKNNNIVDEERTLEFYHNKRMDELSRFKMHLLFASQDYENREDYLYNRFIEYSAFNDENTQNDIHYRTLLKIVEKFHRNEEIPPSKDIATREFDFVENEIRLRYHYNGEQYTQASRTFIKPAKTDRGDHLVYLPHMTTNYNPDPMATPEDFDNLIDLLEKQLNAEDSSVMLIRKGESEIFTFLQSRAKEFMQPELKVSPFDPIRNQEVETELYAIKEQKKIQSEKDMKESFDLLSPYFSRVGNVKYLTHKQALQIRTDCVEDFKQTSVNRANSMKQDYVKCKEQLEKVQTTLTQTEGLSKEEKERLLESNNKMTLKLHALEVRLNRYREIVSRQYQKLLELLQNNGRLSILYDE